MATFEQAGKSEDLNQEYRRARISEYRESGDLIFHEVNSRINPKLPESYSEENEMLARQGLFAYSRSLDWAEDTEYEKACHENLDKAGRWVRKSFGCEILFEEGTYYETCPVSLAHTRMGFSVGGKAKRICSLCGQDVSECEHDRRTAYMVPGGHKDLGWCRVCILKTDCGHSPTESYRVGVVAIITELELTEISLVSKPAHPEARQRKVSISSSRLKESLGPEFHIGGPVSCDKCLLECQGLHRPDFSSIEQRESR